MDDVCIKEPIDVGDLLTFESTGTRYTVSSMSASNNGQDLMVYVTARGTEKPQYFGNVRKSDRTPTGAWNGWVLTKGTHLTPAPVPSALARESSDWRAWRDNGLQPGHCVCRIPREKCDFHR